MNKSFFAALLASAFPLLCGAQQVYRCGNTFSQAPCASAASAVRLSSTAAPDAAPGLRGEELCRAAVGPRFLPISDPAQARVESLAKAGAQAIDYAGQSVVARKYVMTIGITSTAGLYVGAMKYACYLSEDELRILKFAAVR